MHRRWTPIEDYGSHAALATAELGALAQVWREQRERLGNQEAYRQFEERLKREWAIETGLIERLYTLDRGISQLLIEHGIRAALIPHEHGANPGAIVAMIADHKTAVEGVFDFVKGERPLSTSYIKELHALMTQHQATVEGVASLGRKTSVPLVRGAYKRLPNNPLRPDGTIHEYCPPEQIDSEMDRLMALHHQHDDVAPEVEAAWLHHRFTQIHPFQDGNGRIARALATLVFVKAGWFPLVVRDRQRAEYIDALETADDGDLKPAGRVLRTSAAQRIHPRAERCRGRPAGAPRCGHHRVSAATTETTEGLSCYRMGSRQVHRRGVAESSRTPVGRRGGGAEAGNVRRPRAWRLLCRRRGTGG